MEAESSGIWQKDDWAADSAGVHLPTAGSRNCRRWSAGRWDRVEDGEGRGWMLQDGAEMVSASFSRLCSVCWTDRGNGAMCWTEPEDVNRRCASSDIYKEVSRGC